MQPQARGCFSQCTRCRTAALQMGEEIPLAPNAALGDRRDSSIGEQELIKFTGITEEESI